VAGVGDTIVILMGGQVLLAIAAELQRAGLTPTTPTERVCDRTRPERTGVRPALDREALEHAHRGHPHAALGSEPRAH
jgi:siroheme synthase